MYPGINFSLFYGSSYGKCHFCLPISDYSIYLPWKLHKRYCHSTKCSAMEFFHHLLLFQPITKQQNIFYTVYVVGSKHKCSLRVNLLFRSSQFFFCPLKFDNYCNNYYFFLVPDVGRSPKLLTMHNARNGYPNQNFF